MPRKRATTAKKNCKVVDAEGEEKTEARVTRRSTRRSAAKTEVESSTEESRPGTPVGNASSSSKKNVQKGRRSKKNLSESEDSSRPSTPEDVVALKRGSVFRYDFTELLSCTQFDKPHLVTTIAPEEFNEEYFEEPGLIKPILFDCPPEKLGMIMPDPDNFDVDDVVRLVGEKRQIEVIKVSQQEASHMSMGDIGKYYKNPQGELINVLSCEFSTSPLRGSVSGPELIRTAIDMTALHFPDQLRRRQTDVSKSGLFSFENYFPQVEHYCLLSVAGCYTDFHVDFGGTSVWYHVLKGEKIFWLIPPTDHNLYLYNLFTKQYDISDFLGRVVDDCHRLVIKAGQTAILPSGWIHAVYTPKTSLVFGGNFLHWRSCSTQCNISWLEMKMQTNARYRFPYFDDLHFYMIADWVKWCTGRIYVRPIVWEDETCLYVGEQFVKNKGYMEPVNAEPFKKPGTKRGSKDLSAEEAEEKKQESCIQPTTSPHPQKTVPIDTGVNVFYDAGVEFFVKKTKTDVHSKFEDPEDELTFIQEGMNKMTKSILLNFEAELDFIHTQRRFDVPENITRPDSLIHAFSIILVERRKQLEAQGVDLPPASKKFSDMKKQKKKEQREERKKKRQEEAELALAKVTVKKAPKPRKPRGQKSTGSAESSRPVTPHSEAPSEEIGCFSHDEQVQKASVKVEIVDSNDVKEEEGSEDSKKIEDSIKIEDQVEEKVIVKNDDSKDEVKEDKVSENDGREDDISDMEEFIVDEEVAAKTEATEETDGFPNDDEKVEVPIDTISAPEIVQTKEVQDNKDEMTEASSVNNSPTQSTDNRTSEVPLEIDVSMGTSEVIKTEEKEEIKENEAAKDDTTSSANELREKTAPEAAEEDSRSGTETNKEEEPMKIEESTKESPAMTDKEEMAKASPTKRSPKEDKEKKEEEKEKKRMEKEEKRKAKEERKKAKEERKEERAKIRKDREERRAKKRKSSFEEALAAPDKKKKKNDKKDKPQFVGGLPMAPIQHEPVVPNLYNYDPMAEIMQLGTGQLHSAYRKSRLTVAPPAEKKFYKLEHKPSETKEGEAEEHAEPTGSTTPAYAARDTTPPHMPPLPTLVMVTPAPLNFGQRRSTFSGHATTSGISQQADRRPSFDHHNITPRSSIITPQAERRPAVEHSYRPQDNKPQNERRPSFDYGYFNNQTPSRPSNNTYSPGGIRSEAFERRNSFGRPISVNTIADVPIPQRPSPSFTSSVPQHYSPSFASTINPPSLNTELPPFFKPESQAPPPEPRRPRMTPREFAAMLDAKREVLDQLNLV